MKGMLLCHGLILLHWGMQSAPFGYGCSLVDFMHFGKLGNSSYTSSSGNNGIAKWWIPSNHSKTFYKSCTPSKKYWICNNTQKCNIMHRAVFFMCASGAMHINQCEVNMPLLASWQIFSCSLCWPTGKCSTVVNCRPDVFRLNSLFDHFCKTYVSKRFTAIHKWNMDSVINLEKQRGMPLWGVLILYSNKVDGKLTDSERS